MENYYLEIALVTALALNVVAGVRVAKSDVFEKPQKIAQIVLIFLIPFIAAVGILLFLRSEEKPLTSNANKGGKGHSSLDASSGD